MVIWIRMGEWMRYDIVLIIRLYGAGYDVIWEYNIILKIRLCGVWCGVLEGKELSVGWEVIGGEMERKVEEKVRNWDGV